MRATDVISLPYIQTIHPLGKVTVEYRPDGSKRVKAYLIGEHIRADTQTGLAIEGSLAMKSVFGYKGKLENLLSRQTERNFVSIVAQKIGSYLARKVDADGNTTVLYWATGESGKEIQIIGDLTAYQVENKAFNGPEVWGSEVRLLPAVQYFVNRSKQAGFGMYVFFTQGRIDDLEDIKAFTIQVAQEIISGRRNDLKFVLVGIGSNINKKYMEELDTLSMMVPLDLWDFRIASEMKNVIEIFTEMADANTIVSPCGRILDFKGKVLVDYSDCGVPALIMFTLPGEAKSFSLELADKVITQPIP